jgi:hypothetical protein
MSSEAPQSHQVSRKPTPADAAPLQAATPAPPPAVAPAPAAAQADAPPALVVPASPNPQSVWTYDLLWAKAVAYMGRALSVARDSDLFPFWASLSLEFLARSTLARISPTLLADTSESDGRFHLLYSLGFEPKISAYIPKSISITEAFARCEQIVPSFTKEMATFCRGFVNKRNEELHSGGTPFVSLHNNTWLPKFYQAASTFLAFHERPLTDFVGAEEANAANVMMTAIADEASKSVQKKINAFAEVWKTRKEEDRKTLSASTSWLADSSDGHVTVCPSCGSRALITGEEIKQQPPALEEDEIVVRTAMLPTALECKACGLFIHGHNELHAAGLGGQFTKTATFDPFSFYAGEEEYTGPEYNND